MQSKIRIGVLISGGGSNLQAILDACRQGHIPADVAVVVADRPQAIGLNRARKEGKPALVVDYSDILHRHRSSPQTMALPSDIDLQMVVRKQRLFDGQDDAARMASLLIPRILAELQLLSLLVPFDLDLLVLAGFMRNLTPFFIDRFNLEPDRPRIMNIHPALLPAFPGVDGYCDTLHYGCKLAGCTVHFIDYGEDSGPIIAQRSFAIEEDDTLDTVRRKGLEIEWQLYPECIGLFARRRLQVVTMTYTGKDGLPYHRRVVKIITTQD